jgi:hypothetical protein
MTARSTLYWTTTTVTSLAFLSGGAACLLHVEANVQGMTALGYPLYFVSMIGAWKVLGGLALLAPATPRLKEWAYAGIAFDLIGAAFSHFSVGHAPEKVLIPLVILAVAAISWGLRPARRYASPVTRVSTTLAVPQLV